MIYAWMMKAAAFTIVWTGFLAILCACLWTSLELRAMTWSEFVASVRKAGEEVDAEQRPPPWTPEAIAEITRLARPRLRVVRVRDVRRETR